jgi:hypothetical protein
MIGDGNQVANFRRSELQRLDETLNCISRGQSQPLTVPNFFHQTDVLLNPSSPSSTSIPRSTPHPLHYNALLRQDPVLDGDCDFGTMLTSAEIMAVADSIETFDTEWVSNAMVEHGIW